MLYHISDSPEIAHFTPRQTSTGKSLIWAIDDAHLHNYLLPRDCPRVTFLNTGGDHRLLHGVSAQAVVAIEAAWLGRALNTVLYAYELDPAGFTCCDPTAGYYVSESPVVPGAVRKIESPIRELLAGNVSFEFFRRYGTCTTRSWHPACPFRSYECAMLLHEKVSKSELCLSE